MLATSQAPEAPTLVVEPSERAAGAARGFVGARLREWGIADGYTARLVVSELVTNAWLHGEGPIVVRVFQDERDGLVMIEVWDGGAGRPVVRAENHAATSGRGLLLVAELVHDWGVRPLNEDGKIVWAKCAA